jgi:hypothetical protein
MRVQSAHPGSVGGLQRYGSLKAEDLKRKSWAIGHNANGLTSENKALFDRYSEH